VRRFFEYLARRGVPMRASLAWLGRARIGRPRRRRSVPSELAPAIERYLDHCGAVRRLAPSTLEAYAAILHRFSFFAARVGSTSWSSMSIEVVNRYLVSRRSLGTSTLRSHYATLRAFFDRLAQLGERGNDWDRVGQAPRISRALPQVLSHDEVDRLLNIRGTRPTDLRDRALLELSYATGARSREMLELRIEALNLGDHSLRVIGKGDRERTVLFGRCAHAAMVIYLEQARPALADDPRERRVFLSDSGHALTAGSFRRIVQRRARQAGIERRAWPHLLRHSFASHLLAGGADLRVVQELLGHASVATTAIYTHLDRGYLREVHRTFHPRHAPALVEVGADAR
jgi:integrase/recombinase XerD